jgi:hypothetical protein
MDERGFDALVRSLAAGRSRRQVLKGLLGLGGAAVATAAALPDDAHAARRGHSGPVFPTPCVPTCDGTTCGANGCGGTCSCGRDLLCIPDTGLCGRVCAPSDPSGSCSSGCACDPFHFVCVSNQSMGNCSTSASCPIGTFCHESDTCRAPCTSA